MAFKVTDDDKTHYYDRTWEQWSGAASLCTQLNRKYALRKVACYKGVNVVPDVFKYVVLIEFIMQDDQNEVYARDCMQKFRIGRMSGYAALYKDFHTKDIEKAINDETEKVTASAVESWKTVRI